jgi:hypothetical protein
MHSSLSTRSLLLALAILIAAACVYFLFSALNGGGARGGADGNAPQLTVEEKAEVLLLYHPNERGKSDRDAFRGSGAAARA